MGKYANYRRESVKEPPKWKIHPIWRGIGLFMMILIPIIAYAGSVEFLKYNLSHPTIPISARMYQPTGFVGVTVEEAGGRKFGINVGVQLGVILFTGIFSGVGFGLFTLVYAIIYRFTAPPRYLGADSPPVGKYRPRDGKKGSIPHRR
jgi:hypothetical protein